MLSRPHGRSDAGLGLVADMRVRALNDLVAEQNPTPAAMSALVMQVHAAQSTSELHMDMPPQEITARGLSDQLLFLYAALGFDEAQRRILSLS